MNNMVPVRNTTTCNRCGDSQVGWYKTKAGKWMLCAAYSAGHGQYSVNIMGPHKCIVPPLPGYPKTKEAK